MNTTETLAALLPTLPDPSSRGPDGTGTYFNLFTEKQVREYASEALRAQAAQGEPVAYIIRHANREDRRGMVIHADEVGSYQRASLSRQPLYAAPSAVPDGFVLVPVSITPEMERAGGHANSEWLNDNAPIGEARYAMPMDSVWAAMLAASPTPPAVVAGDAPGQDLIKALDVLAWDGYLTSPEVETVSQAARPLRAQLVAQPITGVSAAEKQAVANISADGPGFLGGVN